AARARAQRLTQAPGGSGTGSTGDRAMSRAPLDSEPGELLRQLAQQNIPSDPDDGSPARRDRLVRAMKDSVERSAEIAEKTRHFRRGAALVAVAAGFLLLSGLLLKQYGASASPSAIAGLDR